MTGDITLALWERTFALVLSSSEMSTHFIFLAVGFRATRPSRTATTGCDLGGFAIGLGLLFGLDCVEWGREAPELAISNSHVGLLSPGCLPWVEVPGSPSSLRDNSPRVCRIISRSRGGLHSVCALGILSFRSRLSFAFDPFRLWLFSERVGALRPFAGIEGFGSESPVSQVIAFISAAKSSTSDVTTICLGARFVSLGADLGFGLGRLEVALLGDGDLACF